MANEKNGEAGNIPSRVQCVISLLVIFSFTINMYLLPVVVGRAVVHWLDDVTLDVVNVIKY